VISDIFIFSERQKNRNAMTSGYIKLFKLSVLLWASATVTACTTYPSVIAKYETPEVTSLGDAADDPAIWFNVAAPEQSLIFGTDKKSGVYVYTLQGVEIGYSALGKINNIDVRSLNGMSYIFASNRTDQTIDLWAFPNAKIAQGAADGMFSLGSERLVRSASSINIYGACAGVDKDLGLISFITEDEGPRVEVWQFIDSQLILLTTFDNGGESEGCVYDDENRTLFVSEEEVNGVLKAYQVDKSLDFSKHTEIDSRVGNIGGDPEGLALYKTSKNEGYVILSSQGDSKFNMYQRTPPYAYIGSFVVQGGLTQGGQFIDGTTVTDGIDVLNMPLNADFPNGLMVVQDDENDSVKKSKVKRQNFKLISFLDVLNTLELR